MNYILFDQEETHQNLLPLTYVRPISLLRVGIMTIIDKWDHFLGQTPSVLTLDYLQNKFTHYWHPDNIVINSSICPDGQLVEVIKNLEKNEYLVKDKMLLAARVSDEQSFEAIKTSDLSKGKKYNKDIQAIRNPWDIFVHNGQQITSDFEIITAGRQSDTLSDMHTIAYNPEQIFIEPGAKIKAAVLDADSGPIYIGKNTTIHPGCVVIGPFSLGEGSHLNPGAKMRGDTTIGPYCKVGGEVSNSVLLGYSNKAHEGFLGNSVVAEWCNLGADTNTSNLKNNYSNVKVWNYTSRRFIDSGRQFVGLIMGDHSKCSINTMFNTGTVVGICSNIYGAGFPSKFIPSFSWGGADSGWTHYELEKLFEVESKMMIRRNKELTNSYKAMLELLYEKTNQLRVYS